jgi:hypothetical protein
LFSCGGWSINCGGFVRQRTYLALLLKALEELVTAVRITGMNRKLEDRPVPEYLCAWWMLQLSYLNVKIEMKARRRKSSLAVESKPTSLV